jgi:membrane-bound metal-dependent hydrolase YbcI (DUF457 family)
MASPVGHAAVGVAAAAVVARATGTPPSLVLWGGAVIASGIPDLDFAFPVLGFSMRFHRGASHALLVMALEVVAGMLVVHWLAPQVSPAFVLAWSAALFTHPLLDIVTTGPTLAEFGWGIPLFWPFSRRRLFVARPLGGDRGVSHSLGENVREMVDDARRIVPACAAIVLVSFLWK